MEEGRRPLEERLRQEVGSSKARVRTGSPTGNFKNKLDELEARNFSLEEEVKDIKIQLSDKQTEISRAQDVLNKRTAEFEKARLEYEEKMKKMRALVNAASKQITELRQTVSNKDAEIKSLEESVERLNEKDAEAKSTVDDIEKSMNKLTTELHSQSAMYTTQIEQLESKLRQSTQQVTQIKAEFQQYKQRAHALLEERALEDSTSMNAADQLNVSELQDMVESLKGELSQKSSELKQTQEKLKNVEKELDRSLARGSDMENEMQKAQRAARQNAEIAKEAQDLLQAAIKERDADRKELSTLRSSQSGVNDSRDNLLIHENESLKESLSQKNNENTELQRISEQLSEELSDVRAQLVEKAEQLEEQRRQAAGRPGFRLARPASPLQRSGSLDRLMNGNRSASPPSPALSAGRPSGSYTTLSDLLADTTDHKPPSPHFLGGTSTSTPVTDKEREYIAKLQHMAELLNDSEATVKRLEVQEKFLKEEIRKMDRFEKRQDLSVEYLKNVVLKFLETSPAEREPIIAVIQTILQLDPEETKRLREKALEKQSAARTFGII